MRLDSLKSRSTFLENICLGVEKTNLKKILVFSLAFVVMELIGHKGSDKLAF
jgi:hypothetical protein